MTDDWLVELKRHWCSSLDVIEWTDGWRQVRTPFLEDDGDELAVFVRNRDGQWEISDRGHTASHLGLDEFSFTQARQERMARLVDAAGYTLRAEAEVVHLISEEPSAYDLADFLQVLAQVRALPHVEAPRDIERFVRQGIERVAEWIPEDRRELNWRHGRDTEKAFPVDVHVRPAIAFDGMNIFMVGSAEKADRSANVATQLHEWGDDSPMLAVVSSAVERKSLVRLRSRLGQENVVSAAYGQWEPVHDVLVDRRAPVLPHDPTQGRLGSGDDGAPSGG